MADLRLWHLRLVNALLAIVAVVLPFVSMYWPSRVPPPAAAAISILFVGTVVAHTAGRMTTARAAQVLIVTSGALVLAGSALHLLRHPYTAAALEAETWNSARALILLVGGAYVTLGRRRGRRAAVAAIAIWVTINLSIIETMATLPLLSEAVLVPVLDVVVSTVLAAVLFDVAALNARHLEETRRDARRLAAVDALTCVNNRHGVMPYMEAALEGPGEAALIVLDLDHFKRVNDTHGHHGGDRILQEVGRVLAAAAREGDAVGRWGGEEFVVVLQAGGIEAAERVARKLRAGIHDIRADFPMSASFGVATVRPADTTESLFKRADDALYQAKSNGRDRIVVAKPEGVTVDLTSEGARKAREVNRDALVEASRERARLN